MFCAIYSISLSDLAATGEGRHCVLAGGPQRPAIGVNKKTDTCTVESVES